MMTLGKFLCRPSVVATLGVSLPSRKRSFSSLRSPVLYRGRLTRKHGFGISLNIRSSMSSPTSPAWPQKQIQQTDRVLEGKNDDHGGVIVEIPGDDPVDPVAFASSLKASLSRWKQQGKRGIWIKIPIELVNLVEPTVKEGFYFHHAEPKYVMLVCWLPSTANILPVNASHRVGIGAFVLNENNEVLVVMEKSGRLCGMGVWKLPTGVVDAGEDVCDAAVREVKEETGVDAKFLEVLAFRQTHKAYFEKSDLFFLCMLQPLSSDIMPQEAEIEAAKWMPYEEYLAQPFVQKSEFLRTTANICEARKNKVYTGFSPISTMMTFSKQKAYFYVNKQGLDSL